MHAVIATEGDLAEVLWLIAAIVFCIDVATRFANAAWHTTYSGLLISVGLALVAGGLFFA